MNGAATWDVSWAMIDFTIESTSSRALAKTLFLNSRRDHFHHAAVEIIELDFIFFDEPNGAKLLTGIAPTAKVPISDEDGFLHGLLTICA